MFSWRAFSWFFFVSKFYAIPALMWWKWAMFVEMILATTSKWLAWKILFNCCKSENFWKWFFLFEIALTDETPFSIMWVFDWIFFKLWESRSKSVIVSFAPCLCKSLIDVCFLHLYWKVTLVHTQRSKHLNIKWFAEFVSPSHIKNVVFVFIFAKLKAFVRIMENSFTRSKYVT